MAAGAAFLELAAALTPAPDRRTARMLAAAKAKRDAGALDAALGLLVRVEAGPHDALQAAQVEYLRGEIAFDQLRVRKRLNCCKVRPAALNPCAPSHPARRVCGRWTPRCGWRVRMVRHRAASWQRLLPPAGGPPSPQPPRAVDVLLDAFVARFTDGYAAAAPLFNRAIEMLLTADVVAGQPDSWLPITRSKMSATLAAEVWDADPGMRWRCARHIRPYDRRPYPSAVRAALPCLDAVAAR